MRKLILVLLPAIFVIITSFNCRHTDEIVNYLNTAQVITVNNQQYKLSWSSHPVSNYYKQEYLPAGEKADGYKSMLLVDFLLIDTPAKDIVGVKVHELVERKKHDAVANLMVRKNPTNGEYLLDFILSDGDEQKLSIVELNAYRYKNFTDKSGHKGVLLFGLSKRAYKGDIKPFMQNLNNERHDITNTIAQTDFPDIEIK